MHLSGLRVSEATHRTGLGGRIVFWVHQPCWPEGVRGSRGLRSCAASLYLPNSKLLHPLPL